MLIYLVDIDYLDNKNNSFHFEVKEIDKNKYRIVLQQRNHKTQLTTDLFQFPYMSKFEPNKLIERLHEKTVRDEVLYFYNVTQESEYSI